MKVRFFEHTYFSNLEENPVLIDLGACTGEFTSHFLSAYPTGTAYMIEPLKRNFNAIQTIEQRSGFRCNNWKRNRVFFHGAGTLFPANPYSQARVRRRVRLRLVDGKNN